MAVERGYRYERKFLVEALDRHQVFALIRRHPAMFYQPYPPRHINNFYLDTQEMNHYHDNVVGSAERQKVRIRWYGELFGEISKPVLEFKVKKGLVGTKISYPFPPFYLGAGFSHDDFLKLLHQADLPLDVKEYLRGLNIVLLNRYYRWYFATHDGRYRVTLDTTLSYYQMRMMNNHFIHHYQNRREIVVEFKYGPEHEMQAQRISNFFPFIVTKSSKYVQGIESVYH